MPVTIVKNDITKIRCDAIVNPTNRRLMPSGGVDEAIHKAAGGELFDACQKLGGLEVGQAKITPAYKLPCKFVIHTVGPWWQGGTANEQALLESCYTEALKLAKGAKCDSVAFPLISSGLHGYPKQSVLQVALSVIQQFLYEHDMQVYVVIYDKDEYALSPALSNSVSRYIRTEYEGDERMLFSEESICCERSIMPCAPLPRKRDAGAMRHDFAAPQAAEDVFADMCDGFALTLMKFIDEKKMDDVACYKKANVSRQTWHKIINDKAYKPTKKTAICFAVALELSLDNAQKLLATAGFTLSKSSKFDLIIRYCITNRIFDVLEIDAILFQYDQELLSAKS